MPCLYHNAAVHDASILSKTLTLLLGRARHVNNPAGRCPVDGIQEEGARGYPPGRRGQGPAHGVPGSADAGPWRQALRRQGRVREWCGVRLPAWRPEHFGILRQRGELALLWVLIVSCKTDFCSSSDAFRPLSSMKVLGKLDGTLGGAGTTSANDNMLHGSSSQYVVFRSKTKRPFYSPSKAKADAADAAAQRAEEDAAERQLDAEDAKRALMTKSFGTGEAAPRSEDGELVVRRREIHSGRAMSVSTVEWSVAEKTAKPTSALEGYMWEKETQVDRLRERISLALLLSQTKMAMADPTKPKPRDWIGPVKRAGAGGNFVIIPVSTRNEEVENHRLLTHFT